MYDSCAEKLQGISQFFVFGESRSVFDQTDNDGHFISKHADLLHFNQLTKVLADLFINRLTLLVCELNWVNVADYCESFADSLWSRRLFLSDFKNIFHTSLCLWLTRVSWRIIAIGFLSLGFEILVAGAVVTAPSGIVLRLVELIGFHHNSNF